MRTHLPNHHTHHAPKMGRPPASFPPQIQLTRRCTGHERWLVQAVAAPEPAVRPVTDAEPQSESLTDALTQEPRSALQVLMDRANKPQGAPPQRNTPSQGPQRTHKRMARRQELFVANTKPAGALAGALAGMLRVRGCADVSYHSVMTIFKSLKVLALTNIFLSQHDCSCQFVFAKVTDAEHQQRIDMLMADSKRAYHSQDQLQSYPLEPHRALSAAARPAQRPPAHPPASSSPMQPHIPGTGPEPVPNLKDNVYFKLHVWTTRGVQVPAPVRTNSMTAAHMGIQRLEFALDLRHSWHRIAYLSFDTAMNIADSIYNQLTAQLQQATPLQAHHHHHHSEHAQATQQATQHPRPLPTMLYDCDLNQSILIFTALCFVQQRLTAQQPHHVLTVSVFRHEPGRTRRVDGRNGFLFRIQLQPVEAVAQHLKQKRTYRPQRDGEQAGSRHSGRRGQRQGRSGGSGQGGSAAQVQGGQEDGAHTGAKSRHVEGAPEQ